MKIALTGDVMLGRLVDQYVIQNRSVRPEALWGDVLPIMLATDCRLINLECVISDRGEPWHPTTKAFHFRARSRALEEVKYEGGEPVFRIIRSDLPADADLAAENVRLAANHADPRRSRRPLHRTGPVEAFRP